MLFSAGKRAEINKMVLGNLTHPGRIGLLLFVIGAVFFLVGFSVPYWVTSGRSRVGLWDYCTSSIDGSYTYCTGTVSSNFKFFDKDGPPSKYEVTFINEYFDFELY